MIILDTNVVSELMRPEPEKKVQRWIGAQRISTLYLTAISVAEIRRGLALLPVGKRRRRLESAFETFIEQGFAHRVLSFTQESASVYAPLYSARIQNGLGIDELDLLLAAIATEHGASIATRNTSDFEQTGVSLINPWTAKVTQKRGAR